MAKFFTVDRDSAPGSWAREIAQRGDLAPRDAHVIINSAKEPHVFKCVFCDYTEVREPHFGACPNCGDKMRDMHFVPGGA